MTILAKLFGVFLILVALLTGGCSIVFSGFIFQDLAGNPGIFQIWIGGLALAAVCVWIAVKLFRYQPRPPPFDTPKGPQT